jgi:hypothetical protein
MTVRIWNNPIRLWRIAAVTGFVVAMGAGARADVISRFDSGDEGWTVVSFTNLTVADYSLVATYTPNFHASGGNPGGYISGTDQDNGDFTFAAPSAFWGAHAAATSLTWDLNHTGVVDYQASDITITGGGLQLLWKSTPDIVPGAAFQTFSVSLGPAAGWTVGTPGGSAATVADFQTVLGNVTGLFIRGEYTVGLNETSGLDNVRLAEASAVPEPGSVGLLGVGLLGIRWMRRADMASATKTGSVR